MPVTYNAATRSYVFNLKKSTGAEDPIVGNAGGNAGGGIRTADPPASVDKATAQGQKEEQIVEYLTTYIQAKGTISPMSEPFRQGELVYIGGLGSQFSGVYYIRQVSIDKTLEVTLDLVRVNTKLVNPSIKPNPIPTKETRPVREAATPAPTANYHVVSRGETLAMIAKAKYGDSTKWTVIWTANKDMLVKRDARNTKQPGWWIYPGQRLIIP